MGDNADCIILNITDQGDPLPCKTFPPSIVVTEAGWLRISESRPDFIEFLNTSTGVLVERLSDGSVRISGDGLKFTLIEDE